MANNSFTFWANMKETIDCYDTDPVLKCKMYDALVEYGLYEVLPEDDGTLETASIKAFLQSITPSLDKSRNYYKDAAERGSNGGRRQKISDEELVEAIQKAALIKGGIPTRQEVVDQISVVTNGISISTKTFSRRINDDQKKEIATRALAEEGQNRDKTNVPNVPEGQNGDKIDVPANKIQFNF